MGFSVRFKRSKRALMHIALLLVAATTFLQNLVDYYQSRSQGAYQPTLQRILILGVLLLSMLGLVVSYMATAPTHKREQDMARRTRKSKWIQEAVKHPGALTQWFKRHRKELKRKLGFDPITKKGDINDRAIPATIKLAKEGRIKITEKTLRRLYLAKTLQKLRRRKRK